MCRCECMCVHVCVCVRACVCVDSCMTYTYIRTCYIQVYMCVPTNCAMVCMKGVHAREGYTINTVIFFMISIHNN